ncbi:MAG: FAD-dependent oxidoreductase [Patescibacteria group bacterium]
MYDLVIVGGGPAGVAAGVYAARKKIKTLLVAEKFGGQSTVSPGVENWIGDQQLSGLELAKKLEGHVRRYEKAGDIEIADGVRVKEIKKSRHGFSLLTDVRRPLIETRIILVASGSRRKRLGVPGEDEFDGRGLTWCATCDAPLFKDKVVAIIGGGNAGLEAALTLNSYAQKLYLLQRSDKLRGDAVTQEKVKKLKKMTVIFNAEIREVLGSSMVTGLKYKDKKTGKEKLLELGGVFVEIGSVPNSDFVKDLVKLDKWGEIKIDCRTQRTSVDGIWAAGDVSDVIYKQNNISAGDAIKAVLNIFDYLHKNK